MIGRRRRSYALVLSIALACTAGLFAQQKDQKDKKQQEAERREIQAVVGVVDSVAAGQPAPNDFDMKWVREDILKAQGNKEYVPFTVSIDPAKVPGGRIALYWRVVAKNAATTATATATATDTAATTGQKKDDKKDKDKDKDKKKTEYAYEDISFIPSGSNGATVTTESNTSTQGNTTTTSSTSTVNPAGQTPSGAALPPRISRSFTVGAGDYDVYIVAKEPSPEKAPKNAPAPKMSVVKQTVHIPDFWNGELNTSSVIVAQRIDPLPAPLTPQQQADRPYALGTMEIVPAFDTKFTKKSELSTFMLIYNPKTDSANKPDVVVEYNFCQVGAAGTEPPKPGDPCKPGEKFFNKTNPQSLNAQTLPPQFDLAAGHQLQSGQAVPLATFPEGQYRLEIKVTDKLANKTLTRDINFTVSPS